MESANLADMLAESANFEAITTAEVARRLGIGVSTVHDMVSRGELTPALKSPGLRGAYFFRPADVDALAKAREKATA